MLTGCDLKPDPSAAAPPADLLEAVEAFRAWAGNPSYRGMAAGFGLVVAHSTLHAALHREEVPNLGVLVAIITGCGGDSTDVAKFVSAWRRVSMPPGPQGSPRLAVAS
jgi:hypothetical protein